MPMRSAKASLKEAIELLDEQGAGRILDIVQRMVRMPSREGVFNRLAGDPTFRLPPEDARSFQRVKPSRTKGVPASRLLVESRR